MQTAESPCWLLAVSTAVLCWAECWRAGHWADNKLMEPRWTQQHIHNTEHWCIVCSVHWCIVQKAIFLPLLSVYFFTAIVVTPLPPWRLCLLALCPRVPTVAAHYTPVLLPTIHYIPVSHCCCPRILTTILILRGDKRWLETLASPAQL